MCLVEVRPKLRSVRSAASGPPALLPTLTTMPRVVLYAMCCGLTISYATGPQVEKSPKPVASCAMPAAPGMNIKTNTPLVRWTLVVLGVCAPACAEMQAILLGARAAAAAKAGAAAAAAPSSSGVSVGAMVNRRPLHAFALPGSHVAALLPLPHLHSRAMK